MFLKAWGHQQENFGIFYKFFFSKQDFMKSKAEERTGEEEPWEKSV